MIKIENFKHNLTSELENHIEFGIKYEHKNLLVFPQEILFGLFLYTTRNQQ